MTMLAVVSVSSIHQQTLL